MIWLLSRLVVWPVKAVIGTTALGAKTTARTAAGSAKLGYRTGKLFGYGNLVTLGLGAAVGLAVAPRTGQETRELVRQKLVDLGLLGGGGGGWSAESAQPVYAPVEAPSAEPDVAAVGGNGHGGDAAGMPIVEPPPLEGIEGPGPAPASEARFSDEPGTPE